MAYSATHDTTNPGAAVSNYEDLAPWVSRAVQEQTPFCSLASHQKATATFHEWTVDKLKSPSETAGGVNEGSDVSNFSDQHANRERIGNYIQHFRDDYMVSTLQEQAASAGPADLAEAKAKAMIQVKLGMEYQFLSDDDRQSETGSGTPYKTAGMGTFTGSPSWISANYRAVATDANGTSITEAQFQDLMKDLFTTSGEVSGVTGLLSPDLRTTVSGFTRSSTDRFNVNQNAKDLSLTYAVSFFQTDFGTASMITANSDTLPAADRGYLIKPDQYYIADYIPMRSRPLEDQGGGPRGLVECAAALCVKNPRHFGKIS